MFDLLRTCVAVLLLAGFPGLSLFPQNPATAPEAAQTIAQSELLRSFVAEEKRGDSFFYTQSYYALHGQHVFFKGSIYAAIADVKVSGCRIRIDTTIADRYSGTIGKKQVNPTQNVYRISVDFTLAPKIAQSFKVIKARTVQLGEGTHPVCSDHQQCVLNWIELRSERPEMQMTEFTNDIQGYDGFVQVFGGPVDRFLVPVSSPAAADELIERMRALVNLCAR
jgi:hypothetical protein